jgi:biopolymer transport protein ExbB/TolQ
MLIETLSSVLDSLGAEWILFLLLALSVLSVAIVFERMIFLRRNAVPHDLQAQLLTALDQGPKEAAQVLAPHRGMEAQVALAGVRQIHRGSAAVEEIMSAHAALEKIRYDRFLGFLGSLGANAPFVGLLGTVIGIMGAFADLKAAVGGDNGDANRTQAIMGSISEALVATAVGLIVAIPAVWAFNHFKNEIKSVQSRTGAMASILLAHLKSTPAPSADGAVAADAFDNKGSRGA